jgi:hypothetical protein
MPVPKPVVFIGSSTAGLQIAKAVGKELETIATVMSWEIAFEPSKWLLDGLLEQANKSDFGVFIVRSDDTTVIRNTKYRTVRDNVLFEAGIFMGAIGPERTFLLWPRTTGRNKVRLPSDLEGLLRVNYTPPRNRKGSPKFGPEFDTMRACIKRKGPAYRIRHDEIGEMRKELKNREISFRNAPKESLEYILQRAAKLRQQPWNPRIDVEELTDAIGDDNSNAIVDKVFWWLLIYGIIAFNNFRYWSDDPDEWNYEDSLEYTELTGRGVALLNELQAIPRVRP